MSLSIQFQMNKKERVIREFEMDFKKSFCWHSYLKIRDIISPYINMYVMFVILLVWSANRNGF